MTRALEGVKILDLGRLVPYQFATLLLADLGAEVLKIEEPTLGDYGRTLGPKYKEEAVAFLLCNRNKKSMKLNLKTEKGREVFLALVEEYDVVFEAFRPGVMDRLGLSYETLKGVNPRIIYVSGTGYGQEGPYEQKAGHDINYIGSVGILGVSGRHAGRPIIPGIPIADMAGGGVFPAFGILAALLARERTGLGQKVDVAMTDCMAAFCVLPIANHISSQMNPGIRPLPLGGVAPCYAVYKTKDGKFVASGNIEDKFWQNFCKALGREDLLEHQFALGEKGEQVRAELDEIFQTKTRDEWVELMSEWDVCFGPVLEMDEMMEDPQLKGARNMFFTMEHPVEGEIPQIGFPVKLSETPGEAVTPSPTFGQHTEEVLKGLGYTDEQIENLHSEKVI
jgi:crotonobetainyl-CoA:carnitine CoA-transferase CaiB-like acyl-CoA transferase